MKNKIVIIEIVIVILFLTSCQNQAELRNPFVAHILPHSPSLFLSTHFIKTVSSKPASPSWPKSAPVPTPFPIPKLDGKTVSKNSAAAIDLSYISYGFIKVRLVKPASQKIKVGVQHGGQIYYYNLRGDGGTEVYPLQMGNGSYYITIYKNISGNQYTSLLSAAVNVSISNRFAPYLVPNQIVNYNASSHAAALAKKLVSRKSNNYERISAVLSYVAKNISYDYKLAKSVGVDYVPNIDSDLKKGKGICYDYAAVSAAMLRSLGYPTKLLMGYVKNGDVYHAWNEVYIPGKGWVRVLSVTLETNNWSIIDTTFISTSKSPGTIAKYINNSGNYKADKIY